MVAQTTVTPTPAAVNAIAMETWRFIQLIYFLLVSMAIYTDMREPHTQPTWLYRLLRYKEIIEYCQWVRLTPRASSSSTRGSYVGLGDHGLDVSLLSPNGRDLLCLLGS